MIKKDSSVPDPDSLCEHSAIQLPKKHCGFAGCQWNGNTDDELIEHLVSWDLHKDLWPSILSLVPHSRKDAKIAVYSVYCEAIAVKMRKGAPLDTYSIDRRSLFNYVENLNNDQICSLVCFCCARRFPYVEDLDGRILFNGTNLFNTRKRQHL